jgi:hypothetical protein
VQNNKLAFLLEIDTPKKPDNTVDRYAAPEPQSEAPDSALRNHLNRLGKLYNEPENMDQYSSPVHPRSETLSRFPQAEPAVPRVQSHARKARLDALAQNFKNWEDDYSKLPATPCTQAPSSPVKIGARAGSPSRMQVGSPNRALFSSPVRAQSPARATSPVQAASPVRPMPGSPVRAASPVMNMTSPVRAASPAPKSPFTTPATPVNSPRAVPMGVKSATKNVVWDKAVLATLVNIWLAYLTPFSLFNSYIGAVSKACLF